MKLIRNDLEKKMKEMTEKSGKAAAARAYPLYQKLQTVRFQTENASETGKWPSLTKKYSEYKRKAFKAYPGSGNKLLIATSTLAGAVIGPGSPFKGKENHIAVFKNYSMQIMVKEGGNNAAGKPFDYASQVAEKRPFMEFSSKSIELMKEEIAKFIIGAS